MKKLLSKVISLLVVAVVLCSLSVSAYAAGTVTYIKDAGQFIFEPGSNYSPTDLFSDFKNVMPGDSITQQILIRNDASNQVKIDLYLRSLGAQQDTDLFLSQMNLTVEQAGNPPCLMRRLTRLPNSPIGFIWARSNPEARFY
ncbi:MAG: hypothetical protein IJP30_04500 [Clostridia bacterium]|nr:hypothetical protein [Clostridia bacterium]